MQSDDGTEVTTRSWGEGEDGLEGGWREGRGSKHLVDGSVAWSRRGGRSGRGGGVAEILDGQFPIPRVLQGFLEVNDVPVE